MINTASRALATWAMPALVSLLLGAPLCAQAGEGNDMASLAAAPGPAPDTRPAAAPAAPAAPAAAMAHAATPPRAPAPRPIAAGPVWSDASGNWRQVGVASWYGGRRWQGRPTASGIRYDDRKLTAAHASLPIGSRVRVTVADTGQSVIVTIIDRPGTRRRIIDLSRAAAIELGILGRGVARVALTPA